MKTSKATHKKLLHAILRLLLKKGLKGLTMDLLASELSMSKRTLYEIFGSKHQLISETLDYMFTTLHKMSKEVFDTAPDTITALAEMFQLHGEMLCVVTIDFFHDMDTLYPDIRRIYAEKHSNAIHEWEDIYRRGIEEGVLRDDINYMVLCEMVSVQMEALKRMENRFAGQFTLEEIFNTITTGFLRSISSDKGLKIINSFVPKNRQDQFLTFINGK